MFILRHSTQSNRLRQFNSRSPTAAIVLSILNSAVLLAACAPDEVTSQGTDLQYDVAPSHYPFWSAWCPGNCDHEDMTKLALNFINKDIAERIGEANANTDSGATQFQSSYHFDNCRFAESTANVQRLYDDILAALDPDERRLNYAISLFGTLLHLAQDYYAHSNWIEIAGRGLVNRGSFTWPILDSGDLLGDYIILGNDLPTHWVLFPDGRRPWIWDGDRWRKGLMSGTYSDNMDRPLCPISVAIEHGPIFIEFRDEDRYLAKDSPNSYWHDDAVDMAIRQTREEFCRLERLVLLRHGDLGLRLLRTDWDVSESPCKDPRPKVAALIGAAIAI